MAQPAPSVAGHLLPAILFRGGGMLLAIVFPVTGVARAPLARTIQADFPVHGIGCNLLSVVVSASPLLAIRRAAYLLARLELRRLKALLAITATPCIDRRRLSHRPGPLTSERNLEPDVECLPRPRQWASSDYITGQNASV